MELFKSRPRVVYTNAVGDKVYPVVVDIKKGIKSTEDIQFVSSDVNTGILSVAFIQGNDNYNVTGTDVVCSVMRPDASTLELPCEVVGENIVEVPLGINGTSQDGVYSFDFKVFKGENKVVGTPIMNYSVSLSIDNDMVVEEDDRLPVLTVLMTQLTELKGEARESINQANVATEASREATAKAIEATNNANAVSERVSQETSEAISRVDNKVNEVETRFNTLTTSQQQDAEVIDARDGEVSLKARLDRDIEKAKQVYVELEGSCISTESSTGAIQDLEIKGNTVQDPNNLADIKSVGVLQEDGTYKMSILSCGKNLFNPLNKNIEYSIGGSQNKVTYKVEGDKIIIKSNPSVSSDWGWVEFKNIKVTPNKSYTIHPNATVIKGNVCVFVFDSNNTKLFEIPNTSKTFIPTTKHITIRLYVQTTTLYTDAEIHYKPQLEEGTVATPYEPYQENKCDILLPVQLEKVGDVRDRLICKDGVWGVEKNIKTDLLCGANNEDFRLNKTLAKGGYQFTWSANMGAIANKNSEVISSTMKSYVSSNEDYSSNIWIYDGVTYVIHHPTISTADEIKLWLQTNPTIVKFPTNMPQFIPLPRNTQIALNSFFGTTHVYMESGEVEGTIKCKIPKSLGATVQSLNNKTDILSDRIEAIEGLKDSQNMKYETDKGYLVCKETKNGVIDDLKIEGKTLVNLLNDFTSFTNRNYIYDTFSKVLKSPVGGNDSTIWSSILPITSVECNKSYTLILNVLGTGSRIQVRTDDAYDDINISGLPQGLNIFAFIPKGENFKIKLFDGSTKEQKSFSHLMLLEGDHTQNPPSYFEGLMSVGQDVDKIEVLSNNGNLFDMSRVLYGKSINSNNGDIATTPDWCVNEEFIPVVKGVPLYISRGESISNASSTKGYIYVYQYNKNKVMIGRLEVGTTSVTFTPTINGFIRVALKYDKLIGFGLYRQPNISMPHQSDKKQILFYNENGELEPVQELHEWDSIEKHSDNKWYYHKRSGKVVLNGSEYWQEGLSSQFTDTHMYFACNSFDSIMKDSSLISDKFENKPTWDILSRECIDSATSMDKLRIRLAKSKLSTQDVTGFKQWL